MRTNCPAMPAKTCARLLLEGFPRVYAILFAENFFGDPRPFMLSLRSQSLQTSL